MNTDHIKTPRLDLVPLSLEQLGLYLDDPGQLEKELDLLISRDILTEILKRAISIKREKMAGLPAAHHPWQSYWLIVVEREKFGAGMIGFKGLPNKNGEVEIGYGIDPRVRNRGYTTEAVKAMIHWAFQSEQCTSVIAPDTLRKNVASNSVLVKVGMVVYEESQEAISWRIDKNRIDQE
ncbi:MAG: GNAT family N-acetyltransferase [Anaerolineales bacterium]|nr:GNAT family N-acetyltransferase [Anaerolineales bacterium]